MNGLNNLKRNSMTHNIIKTENYLLVVDDSEVNINQYVYCDLGYIEKVMDIIDGWIYHTNTLGKNPIKHYKKIIAHLPLNNSPVLEFVPLLPPLEDEAESLSLKSVNKRGYTTDDYQDGFEDGYNKAKEKYKYTEEDMVSFADWYHKTQGLPESNIKYWGKDLFEVWKSLQQPKMPVAFECEIFEAKDLKSVDEDWIRLGKHKTTTNSQGQTVLVGKYIY